MSKSTKLYLLSRIEGDLSVDELHNIVVEATSPASARKLASTCAVDEGPEPWLDATRTSCKELKTTGTERVIIEDCPPG